MIPVERDSAENKRRFACVRTVQLGKQCSFEYSFVLTKLTCLRTVLETIFNNFSYVHRSIHALIE